MDFLNSSDGIINGALSKAWQITLTSTNGALKFVNFEPGDQFTLVVKEDTSGSNYTLTFPSSVLWQAKVAPNRDTTANAVSVFTFSYDGTNFRDVGASAKGLPSRTQSAALGTILGIGATILTLSLSGGNGQGPGALQPAIKIASNSGAQLLSVVDGSGSLGVGSGSVTIGSLTKTNAKVQARVQGAHGNANASGVLTVDGTKGGYLCFKNLQNSGYTKFVASGSNMVTKISTGNECP